MTRIVVTEFISLDGVVEEPRWTFQFERGPEGSKFKFDELFASEALLLGRVTYQGFAQAWPSMGTDEFGKRMNSIPKYVVSSTLTDACGAISRGHTRSRQPSMPCTATRRPPPPRTGVRSCDSTTSC